MALASAATAIVLVIGFLAVAALRYVRGATIAACVNVAGIGYAVPGTVLALGLLSPLALVADDRADHAAGSAAPARSCSPARCGGRVAYVIRFLAMRGRRHRRPGFGPHRDRARRQASRLLGEPGRARCARPPAAAAAGDRAPARCWCSSMHEGTAGHPAAAAGQLRHARDLALRRGRPRHLRGRRDRRAGHRGRGTPAGDLHHPPCRHRCGAWRHPA